MCVLRNVAIVGKPWVAFHSYGCNLDTRHTDEEHCLLRQRPSTPISLLKNGQEEFLSVSLRCGGAQCPAAKAAVIKKHKGEVNNLDHLSTMLCSAGKPRVTPFRWMLLETHHLCWCTSDGNSKGGASQVTSTFVCKYVSFLLLSQTLIVLKFVRVHAEFLLRQLCKEAATEHSKFSSAYDD